jgi:hypothetical protein
MRTVSLRNRVASHPPYPSKDGGGRDTIRVHMRPFRSGNSEMRRSTVSIRPIRPRPEPVAVGGTMEIETRSFQMQINLSQIIV